MHFSKMSVFVYRVYTPVDCSYLRDVMRLVAGDLHDVAVARLTDYHCIIH